MRYLHRELRHFLKRSTFGLSVSVVLFCFCADGAMDRLSNVSIATPPVLRKQRRGFSLSARKPCHRNFKIKLRRNRDSFSIVQML